MIVFRKLFIIATFALLFILPIHVQAAKLFLESTDSGEVETEVEMHFQARLKLDTREQSVNALEAKIIYPPDIVKLQAISQGDSIVSYWVKEPEEETPGTIVFSGIVPGGYDGVDGQVLAFEFLGLQEGAFRLSIEEEKVLLNDGAGSELSTVLSGLNVTITAAKEGQEAENQTSSSFSDSVPPEQFTPAISRHEDMFDGKWFISFYARDKNLGIDHYEVLENNKNIDFDKKKVDDYDWTTAESPYLLNDQELKSFVYVKAVDKAGNQTIAKVQPKYKSLFVSRKSNSFVTAAIFLLAGLAIFGIIMKKVLQKKYKAKNG